MVQSTKQLSGRKGGGGGGGGAEGGRYRDEDR